MTSGTLSLLQLAEPLAGRLPADTELLADLLPGGALGPDHGDDPVFERIQAPAKRCQLGQNRDVGRSLAVHRPQSVVAAATGVYATSLFRTDRAALPFLPVGGDGGSLCHCPSVGLPWASEQVFFPRPFAGLETGRDWVTR